MVHQSAQNLKKVEACYKAAQQQADQHVAAERASVRDFLRLFVDQPVKDSSGREALLAENNDLRRQFQSIQSQHSSQLEVTEKTANELAKVIAENDDLKQRLLNQERSLNTLGQEIISLQDSQKQSIKNVEQSVTTLRQDMSDISKTAEKFLEFESFRKSSQLKAKDTQGALEAVDERVLSIEKTVSVIGTVKNELDSLKKSNEAQSGRIKNLLENLTAQRAETKALGTSMDQLSTTQRAEIKALGTNMDQLSESWTTIKPRQ
jgi:chromosome segregation ATPase